MSKLLSKAIAVVAIVLLWCMTTIGSTVATMLGTTIGATTLATAITAATITPAEARRRGRGRGGFRRGRSRRGGFRRGRSRGYRRGRYRRGRYRRGGYRRGGYGWWGPSIYFGWGGYPYSAGDTGGRNQSTIMKSLTGRSDGSARLFLVKNHAGLKDANMGREAPAGCNLRSRGGIMVLERRDRRNHA